MCSGPNRQSMRRKEYGLGRTEHHVGQRRKPGRLLSRLSADKRAVYYCGRMLSAQYGTVFTNSHDEKVKRVISLWVCLNPPFTGSGTKRMMFLGR